MARDYTGGTALASGTPPVTAVPFTIACWARVPTLAAAGLAGLTDNSTSNQFVMFPVGASPTNLSIRSSAAGVNRTATTTGTAWVNNTWTHLCAVFASSTSRSAYVNGGNKGTDTNSSSPTGISNHYVCASSTGSAAQGVRGHVAEYAIWNVALTDAEVAILALGVSPILVRPNALVLYVPMLGAYSPEIDLVGKRNLTLTGSPPASAHPRILYPNGLRPNAKLGIVARSLTASLNAALQKNRTATASLNAALQKAFSKTASLDAALQKGRSVTASLDAVRQKGITSTAQLNAALQKLGITATASVNAGLAVPGSQSASLDSILQKGRTATVGGDAALQKTLTGSVLIGAAIQAAMSQSASVDAALAAVHRLNVAIDAAIYAAPTPGNPDHIATVAARLAGMEVESTRSVLLPAGSSGLEVGPTTRTARSPGRSRTIKLL